MKLILSIIEGIISGILVISLAKIFIDIGGFEGYFGLICFSFIIISGEIKSYKENNLGWVVSKLFGNIIN